MSARKPRKEKREKREALISQYMSELQEKVVRLEEHYDWLNQGDAYTRSLKLIAEHEIYRLIRAKEVSQDGAKAKAETKTLLANGGKTSGT